MANCIKYASTITVVDETPIDSKSCVKILNSILWQSIMEKIANNEKRKAIPIALDVKKN